MKAIPVLAAFFLLFSACEFERDTLYDDAESAASQENSMFNLHTTSVGYDTISLAWNPVPDAQSYILYRDMSPDFVEPYTFGPSTTEFYDSSLYPITTYYYKVCAQYSDGGEDCSGTLSVRTASLPAPANLVATSGTSTIMLTWDPISGSGTYYVFRDDVQLVSTGNANYIDNSVTPGKTYIYYVTYSLYGILGPPSNIVSATPY